MKLKILTAATMLACAGSANAAIEYNQVGNLGGFSELFVDFVARNSVNPTLDNSIDIDLGGYLNSGDFVDRNNAGTLSQLDGTTIAPNAQLSQFLVDNSSTDFTISWNMVTASSPYRVNFTTFSVEDQGMLTTATNELFPGDERALGITGYNAPDTNVATFTLNVNGILGRGLTTFAENNTLRQTSSGAAFHDQGNLGNRDLFGFPTEGLLGGSAGYYWLGIDNVDNAVSLAPQLLGSWSSLSDGTLTFNSVSAVPVPAAVWLFGSGLVGLVGVARRRKV